MSSQKEIRWPRKLPVLSTERLVLREITRQDVDSYFLLNSDQEVMEMYGVSPHKRKAQTLGLIQFLQKQFRAHLFLRWGIFEKTTGSLLGDIGFWRFVDLRARGEIGIKLTRATWGQGYGSEALRAVVDCAFQKLNFQTIEGNVDTANLGSIGMLKKIGFIEIGVIPQHSYSQSKDAYLDTLLLHLDAKMWTKMNHPKKAQR